MSAPVGPVGVPTGGKRVDLVLLGTELITAGVPHAGLPLVDDRVYTYDSAGVRADLEPLAGAQAVVDAHVAPKQLIEFAGSTAVHAIVRTTDAAPLEVFRFPCDQRRLYQANLSIMGIDAGNFACKAMEGRFVWKRITANAIMTGITVVSDLHDTAAASWAPNALPSGTDVVFTVVGAAGRTIDWLLVGEIGMYAPAGLAT